MCPALWVQPRTTTPVRHRLTIPGRYIASQLNTIPRMSSGDLRAAFPTVNTHRNNHRGRTAGALTHRPHNNRHIHSNPAIRPLMHRSTSRRTIPNNHLNQHLPYRIRLVQHLQPIQLPRSTSTNNRPRPKRPSLRRKLKPL
jgi:hypothetical protein